MMGFDLATAKPVESGFDLSTATPVAKAAPAPTQRTGIKGIYDQVMPQIVEMARPGGMWRMASEAIEKGAYETGALVNDLSAKVLPAPAAAGLGFAANVGIQALPMLLGGSAAKSTAPVMRSGAESLMSSALKPGVAALKRGGGKGAVSTLLDEGINVSKGGLSKMEGKISDLNAQVAQAISSSPATVDKRQVASTLADVIRRFEKQVTPGSDVKAIESAWSEFLQHPLLQKDRIPVQLAQELKQGTYRILKNKYGEIGSASTEAQKALARGLREGIDQAVPAVAGLNARESKMLAALPLLERRVLVEANKNPMGLSLLASHPATFTAFMADRSAAFKSVVARMFNAGKEQIPATAARAGIAGYEINNEQDRQAKANALREYQ